MCYIYSSLGDALRGDVEVEASARNPRGGKPSRRNGWAFITGGVQWEGGALDGGSII